MPVKQSILVVCTANMCRSPMAEALIRCRARAIGLDWHIHSAGTVAVFGWPAAPNAITAMGELGLDIASHRSRPVRAEYIKDASIVLVMSRQHRNEIKRDFGMRPKNLFLFNEMIGKKTDVDDPIGGPVESFLATARELEQKIESGFEWLVSKAT